MKKLSLSLLGLAGVLSATGCGGTKETIVNKQISVLDYSMTQVSHFDNSAKSIRADKSHIVLLVGDSESFNVVVSPLVAYSGELEYNMLDESVANFIDDGSIYGIKAGETYLRISAKNDPTVYTDIKITVQDAITDGWKTALAEVTALTKKLKKYQDDNEIARKEIIQETVNGYYITLKNGEPYRYTKMTNRYVASPKDAFFSLSQSFETKHLGDDYSNFENVTYTFFVNKDYSNAIYKSNDIVKHRFQRLDTTSYVGTYTRYEVLLKILGAFFTKGSKIMTDVVDADLNITYLDGGEEFADYKAQGAFAKKFSGSFYDDEKTMVNSLTYNTYRSGSFGTVGPADESSFEVPAGTPITGYEKMSHTWIDGYYVRENLDIEYDFKDGNDTYAYKVLLEETYDYSLSEVTYPNKSEYLEVYSIGDL